MGRMPDHLRLPLRAASLTLASGLVAWGATACSSPEPQVERADPSVVTARPTVAGNPVAQRMYDVLADVLDPQGRYLADYDGSGDPKSGVGVAKTPDGIGLNAEWEPKGLVGLTVAATWPDGWVCVDRFPGCKPVRLPGGGKAFSLRAGATLSVGWEQPDGDKVIASVNRIPTITADDLARVVVDERLSLAR